MANDLSIDGAQFDGVDVVTFTTQDGGTASYIDEKLIMKKSVYDSNNDGVVNKATKVSNALTVGEKTFDGSVAVEITAGDLGLDDSLSGLKIVICESQAAYEAITTKDPDTIYLVKG